jgi:hypothetical protein
MTAFIWVGSGKRTATCSPNESLWPPTLTSAPGDSVPAKLAALTACCACTGSDGGK